MGLSSALIGALEANWDLGICWAWGSDLGCIGGGGGGGDWAEVAF